MLARLKLWWLNKKIDRAEEYEQELIDNLSYMRNKILPQLRGRRNEMMYPPRSRHGRHIAR